tara:strand:+ start:5524 stop:5655 length:132 start_codon:yes stop_codon:yes gene_type:complete
MNWFSIFKNVGAIRSQTLDDIIELVKANKLNEIKVLLLENGLL